MYFKSPLRGQNEVSQPTDSPVFYSRANFVKKSLFVESWGNNILPDNHILLKNRVLPNIGEL